MMMMMLGPRARCIVLLARCVRFRDGACCVASPSLYEIRGARPNLYRNLLFLYSAALLYA
jgi:hypothetical protein